MVICDKLTKSGREVTGIQISIPIFRGALRSIAFCTSDPSAFPYMLLSQTTTSETTFGTTIDVCADASLPLPFEILLLRDGQALRVEAWDVFSEGCRCRMVGYARHRQSYSSEKRVVVLLDEAGKDHSIL